jgi:hypothetical protein
MGDNFSSKVAGDKRFWFFVLSSLVALLLVSTPILWFLNHRTIALFASASIGASIGIAIGEMRDES